MTDDSSLRSLVVRIHQLIRPPPKSNVAKWADENVWLARGTTTEPGKYKSDRLPYQREPQEGFTDPSVEETIILWAVQTGKTQMILNAVGYFMDNEPCNILVMYPTIDSGKKFSRKKLTRFINENPRLKDRVAPAKSRDSKNTMLEKEFPGGTISIVGANSASSTRAQSCRVIIQDEVDSYKPNAEGDPIEQADRRAENFTDAVKIKASTPTLDNESRIQQLFDRSDQRYWHVPCKACGHFQILKWMNVKWEWNNPDGTVRSDPENAVYCCDKCGCEWSDFDRVRSIMAGKWVAMNPGSASRGYHLSGLYRIMGKKKVFKSYLHEFVMAFLKAKDDRETLMVWTNTFLAEPFKEKADRLQWQVIADRREPVVDEKLPEGVLLMTVAVDVQHDRLEVQTDGWGLGEERWLIDHSKIFGNPTNDPELWRRLDDYFAKQREHPYGFKIKPDMMVIDTGGQHDNYAFSIPVYRYVRARRQGARGQAGIMALKGSSISGAPLANAVLQKNGINLLHVGTDRAKSAIMERLKIGEPGPRYMHYSVAIDDEYFKQLTAEELRTEIHRGFTKRIWVKRRQRNEALDLTVYGLAALDILNADLESISRRFKAIAKQAEIKPAEMSKPVQPVSRTYNMRKRLPFRR